MSVGLLFGSRESKSLTLQRVSYMSCSLCCCRWEGSCNRPTIFILLVVYSPDDEGLESGSKILIVSPPRRSLMSSANSSIKPHRSIKMT